MYTSGRNCISTRSEPSPLHARHWPLAELNEKCPAAKPALRACGEAAKAFLMSSKNPMYEAGFARDVRAGGDWSTSATSSTRSRPSMRSQAPGSPSGVPARAMAARQSTSSSSVLLPDPEGPVTQMNVPSGKAHVTPFRLWQRAPEIRMAARPASGRRRGTAIFSSPRMNAPVRDPGVSATCAGVPSATTLPPR